MLGPLLYFDAQGNVRGTMDVLVNRDEHGVGVGLVDFEAHELAGDRMRRFGVCRWNDSDGPWVDASGAASWPEFLGARAHDFRVELDPAPPAPARARIRALVHRTSGYRRERSAIEAAIAAVAPDPATGARDIRHIVGGPMRPIRLDADGKTAPPVKAGTPAHLPIMGRAT
ncbi:MAG TPA: hypothetical protein VF781_15490 [Solirubrobacteraceae bacterium]